MIIDCCRYLSEEMLAFGKNHVVEGKLPKLVKLLAKHNADARVYQDRIEKSRDENRKLGSIFFKFSELPKYVLFIDHNCHTRYQKK